MLKELLLVTTFVLSLVSANAQKRVDSQDLEFVKISDTLKSATGWLYNTSTGKWIENQNTLYDKQARDAQDRALGVQNFESIYTKTVEWKGGTYYVLFVDNRGSFFKYPSLKEGIVFTQHFTAYIFKESEFKKLSNVKAGKPTVLEPLGVVNEDKNNPGFMHHITEYVTGQTKIHNLETFRVIRSDEGKIRFTLPEYFSRYAKFGFDKGYFETDEANFMKIIPPK